MRTDTLTEREKQIVAHLAAGLRIAGVAHELGVAENTARNHLKSVFLKLDIHTQSELIEFIRDHASIIAPYGHVAGLLTGADVDLADEITEVDRATQKRIDESPASGSGLEQMKSLVHSVLPLDETRRREWRVRLAAHAVAPHQQAVREATRAQHQKWAQRPIHRINDFQSQGWIRADLDPEDVRKRIFSVVYSAVLSILAAPGPDEERRQLAVVDRLLESIAADGESTE